MMTTLRLLVVLSCLMFTTGCAQVLGRLRMDLNDDQASYGPTTGGVYPEAGYLEDERSSVGHYDRSPSALRASDPSTDFSQPTADQRGEENPYARQAEESRDEDRTNKVAAQQPKRLRRVTRNDFIDQSGESGSLWAAEGESNFFFSKNRARSPGDIISITVENEMLRDITLEVKRSLTTSERRKELDILEAKQEAQALRVADAPKATEAKDQVATSAAAPESTELSFSAVDISGVVGMKAGDSVLAEIVERYSNGNYKIRGSKRVPYRNTTKLMSFVGIVRGSDLSTDEKIPSGKIYEYQLQVVR